MKKPERKSNKLKWFFTVDLIVTFVLVVISGILLSFLWLILGAITAFALLTWSYSEFSKKWFKRILAFVLVCFLAVVPIFVILETAKYQSIAQNLAVPERIAHFKNELGRNYNYSELIIWENKHLTFTYGDIQRNTDPIEIFEYGKGRCEEFAILYSALCISQGYPCRIVLGVFNDHVWNEVKINGEWTRVDASLNDTSSRAIGYPLFFEKEKGWTPPILALAFENTFVTDVTSTYRSDHWSLLSGLTFVVILMGTWFAFSIFLIWKKLFQSLHVPHFVFLSAHVHAMNKLFFFYLLDI